MTDTPTDSTKSPPTGTWIVIGMFSFAVLMTSLLFFYWDLHTSPFRELQYALADTFPNSQPRVEGGRRKMHKHTPAILRITLAVTFNPQTEDDQVQKIFGEVEQIARQHASLDEYDELELYLFLRQPEQETLIRSLKKPLKTEEGESS